MQFILLLFYDTCVEVIVFFAFDCSAIYGKQNVKVDKMTWNIACDHRHFISRLLIQVERLQIMNGQFLVYN